MFEPLNAISIPWCIHSDSKKTGLESYEKVLLYVFHHVFFIGMCTVLRSKHMGKPNLDNACLF